MITKKYETKFHEADCKNRIKEAVLLNFLQDIAAEDAEAMGIGYSEIQSKNVGWFLMKYHIKIFKTLKNTGSLSVFTKSQGAVKLSFYRDYDIFDNNNEKIGEATSMWVLVDLATGAIVSPAKVFGEYPLADKSALRSNFPKIAEPKCADYEQTFTATFHDLDVNRHVNNAVYLVWADDVLPLETLLSTRIAELEIQYKQQVKYNEKVQVIAQYDEETNTFSEELKKEDGTQVCLIRQRREKDEE